MELCLLHLLKERDIYGYEILRLLHEQFSDTQESAIYALLRNLCKDGYLETYIGDKSGGPARKYYRITQSGIEKLAGLLNEWRKLWKALEGFGIK